MAAKNLDSDVIKKQELDDMTTCCICTKVFEDPKALPCIHTFCMKCLQETGLKNNRGPGDEMPCPICRRMFKIPTEGFLGLPKNFFIENLIQVTNVSDLSACSRTVCDACLDENKDGPSKEIPVADAYCVQCNQNFCEECCRQHRKLKLTKNHKLIEISEYGAGQNVTDPAPSVCELHERNNLNIYCTNCKTVVCAECFIDDHKNHDGSHVKKFVDGFRKRIESNAEVVNQCRSQAETKKTGLHKVKEDTQERVVALQCVIDSRKDKLRELTDKHAASLLQSLCSMRQSKLKEIEIQTCDIDTYLSCLATYNSQCTKVMTEGSASDICHAFSDLSVKAEHLQGQCQLLIERGIQSFNFCFRESELEEILEECCNNLIGEFEEEGNPKPKTRSKGSVLEEQSNKIDLLKKEIEIKKTENENLTLSNGQLKINIDTEIQANKALRDELDKEKANYDSCTEKLKKVLDENKTTISSLVANNDKLEQELIAIIVTNNSLQADIYQLRQDLLDKEKIIKDLLQTDKGKLKQELDKEKIAKTSLEIDKDKLKQDLDKEKSTTDSLTTSKKELIEEMNMNKTTLKTLEDKVEKPQEELKALKTDSGNKILDLEEKLKQGKTEKEQFRIVHIEEKKQRMSDKLQRSEGPVLVERIRTKAAREGDELYRDLTLAILDEELFIASEKSSEVEVYNSTKLSFSRQWNLVELIDPKDIVSCNGNKCLYIMNHKGIHHEIIRVDRNGKLIKKWSTGDEYGWGLSVTNELNVIVTVFHKNKLLEYSANGKFIRRINLSSGTRICEPWHAMKLSNGDFLVSHGCKPEQLHRLCLVNADGKLKKSFGDISEYDLSQHMSQTFYLAVHGNGFVLVSDRCHSRVLLFDSNLELKGVILSREKHSLQNPAKILLDESNGRLFVVEKDTRVFSVLGQQRVRKENGQILIFDF